MLAKRLLFSESLYKKSAEIQRLFSLHFIFRVDFLFVCCICLSMCSNSYNLKYFENKSFPRINTDSPMKTKNKKKPRSIAYSNIYIHRVKVRNSKAWKIINTLNQNNQEVLKASKCNYSVGNFFVHETDMNFSKTYMNTQ